MLISGAQPQVLFYTFQHIGKVHIPMLLALPNRLLDLASSMRKHEKVILLNSSFFSQ